MKRTPILTTATVSIGLLLAMQGISAAYPDRGRPGAGEKDVAKQEAPGMRTYSGKVVETMNSGGYSYANLERDGKTTWVAFPIEEKLQVGQEITVQSDMPEGSYTSKTLKRTFDRIVFANRLILPKTDSPAPPEGRKPAAGKEEQQAATSSPPASHAMGHQGTLPQAVDNQPVIIGKVAELLRAGNYTYLRLEHEGKSTWVGLPTTKATVGTEVRLLPGQEFTNFKSKALNRSFDSMILSPGEVPVN